VQAAFAALKRYLSQQKKNPPLQVFPFTEVQADVAGGTVLLSGACRVYAAYIKKEAGDETDNFAWIYDDATDDTTAGNARIEFPLTIGGDEQFFIDPAGLPIATGLVVTQYTGPLGTTDGSDGGNGFILVGAA
jgi:hypothetical protein